MFWTGFTTALVLLGGVYFFRWFRQARSWSTPDGVARAQAQELLRCGMMLQAHGIQNAATPLWLHVATHYPQWALIAEYHLSRVLLSGYRTDGAWVEAYEAMVRAHPADTGLLYKLGTALHNLGRTAEAREYWRQVSEVDEAGWKYRAEGDLAATQDGGMAYIRCTRPGRSSRLLC